MMQPHICLAKGDIPPVVLVCGDPDRAKKISELMDSASEIAYNREYRTFVGNYGEQKIAVVSHGIGAAGAAICFEELIQIGARAIIRLGTCGSLQDHLNQGDLIVVSGAVREDGFTRLFAPEGYPAVASSKVVVAMEEAAKESISGKGIVLSTDLFYPGILPSSLEIHRKAGVLAVEMETSALFVIGGIRKIWTGALLVVDGNPLKWDQGDYDPHGVKVAKGKEKMLKIGLDTAISLAQML